MATAGTESPTCRRWWLCLGGVPVTLTLLFLLNVPPLEQTSLSTTGHSIWGVQLMPSNAARLPNVVLPSSRLATRIPALRSMWAAAEPKDRTAVKQVTTAVGRWEPVGPLAALVGLCAGLALGWRHAATSLWGSTSNGSSSAEGASDETAGAPTVSHWKTCRRCKQPFDPQRNGPSACTHHPGPWTGAEASKFYGTRSGGPHTGLVEFWECCDGPKDSLGCTLSKHVSYDDL
eukprot:GGOE01037348.1.p1 GENE.GGOE01037348.1~~GGOE01037348.1.p1  ORF type:complete len:246 (+),score=33.99 GGOE01037348.1:43-738(+)